MWKFITFEWNRWLKSPMLWIFFGVNALLIFGAVSSENVAIGTSSGGSIFSNAPFIIQNYYGVMSIVTLLMTTAFMNASVNRDFSNGMYQFIFTSPIKEADYFFGKFIGAFTSALIPITGVSFGAIIGSYMPWVDAELIGDFMWNGHLNGFFVLALPNTLISAVIVYILAILFRSTLVSFGGAVAFLVLYGISSTFTADLEKEWLAAVLDPFGYAPLELESKFFTVDEKNTQSVGFTGHLLINRIIWTVLAFAALFASSRLFSFSKREKSLVKKERKKSAETLSPDFKKPQAKPKEGFTISAFLSLVWFELKAVIKNPTFIIITGIGMISLIVALTEFTGQYGSQRYPVTYQVVSYIDNSFYLYILAIITFYSGVLVWRERDAKLHEIKDSTPIDSATLLGSKIVAMILAVQVLFVAAIVVGVIAQLLYGFTVLKLHVYAVSLLIISTLEFSFLIVIALLIHYLVNNRYIGYFLFVLFIIANSFLWIILETRTRMVKFGSIPGYTYSDMNGYGPFVPGITWYSIYWALFCALLCVVIYAFYTRGKELHFKARLKTAKERFQKSAVTLSVLSVLFVICGAWVFYNTEVLNSYDSIKEAEQKRVDYELLYKKYQNIAQPRWTELAFEMDIYPEERNLYVSVEALLVNKTDSVIDAVHFSVPPGPDSVLIKINDASLSTHDHRLGYRIYKLKQPLNPGDSLSLSIDITKETKGFENQVSFTSLTQNGTFLNNADFMPQIGYNHNAELSNKSKRKKYDLPKRKKMPLLNEQDTLNRMNTYISNDADWVKLSTVISTAKDQIAVAPGSLVKEWEEGDRRYFRYELDHKALNFYSFISARYEVAREKHNDIDLEVYYIPEHSYNIENMLRSMRKSLDYYTQNFGPYYHKQCRIIEFPRYSSFAQAFPGTMPYSEGIGFITDLRNVTQKDIDVVYYVVAHEMAHQWWAHQVIGPEMRGSVMMSESFAQYSSLMVMEEEYGKDKMRKFLKYETDGYLRGRSSEPEAERPLAEVEQQSYIYYQKGSVVMYYLKEIIGEGAVNRALSNLVDAYAYEEPPYPTSLSALQFFRAETPDSLQYVIDDLFEHITLFSNQIKEAEYEKVGDEYKVTLTLESEKFRADTLGKETTVPLDDFIDIAVFGQNPEAGDLGEPLVFERKRITQQHNTFVYTVPEKPIKAGIDPYNYLIDRDPNDNVMKVKEK